MPQLMTERLARTLYKGRQPQTVVDGVIENPVPPRTYGRAYLEAGTDKFAQRASWLDRLGLSGDVLVVGSAFGYLLQAVIDAGTTSVWGIDGGSWYWVSDNDSEWGTARMQLITANDWIGSGTEQTTLEALPNTPTDAKYDWVVDEDAAPAHSDAEGPVFISSLEDRLKGSDKSQIVHLISPLRVEDGLGDSSQNWRVMTDWKAVAPDHTWVDIASGELV